MFGKVYHVQNLAPKNTSSGLKSIQGIGLLKPSGVHLHTATSQLRHSRGGTTTKWLKLDCPVPILALVQGDVEWF